MLLITAGGCGGSSTTTQSPSTEQGSTPSHGAPARQLASPPSGYPTKCPDSPTFAQLPQAFGIATDGIACHDAEAFIRRVHEVKACRSGACHGDGFFCELRGEPFTENIPMRCGVGTRWLKWTWTG
jgi:hypothetical protein